jgi:peptide-methionine (S)-S-oxide reductase
MGPEGSKENPTYKEVCSGDTGHVEVFRFEFGGKNPRETYESAVRFFFQFHDPTTLNRQGNDKGMYK